MFTKLFSWGSSSGLFYTLYITKYLPKFVASVVSMKPSNLNDQEEKFGENFADFRQIAICLTHLYV